MRKPPDRAIPEPVKSWDTFGKVDTWARQTLSRPWSGIGEPGYEAAPAHAMPLPDCKKKAGVFPSHGNRQQCGIKGIGGDRKFVKWGGKVADFGPADSETDAKWNFIMGKNK